MFVIAFRRAFFFSRACHTQASVPCPSLQATILVQLIPHSVCCGIQVEPVRSWISLLEHDVCFHSRRVDAITRILWSIICSVHRTYTSVADQSTEDPSSFDCAPGVRIRPQSRVSVARNVRIRCGRMCMSRYLAADENGSTAITKS